MGARRRAAPLAPPAAFRHLSQTRGHLAILLRERAVAGRAVQVLVAKLGVECMFGEVLIGLGRPVLTDCGSVHALCHGPLGRPHFLPHALGPFGGAVGFLGDPEIPATFGRLPAGRIHHQRFFRVGRRIDSSAAAETGPVKKTSSRSSFVERRRRRFGGGFGTRATDTFSRTVERHTSTLRGPHRRR
ncbi:hypothetical protein [Mycobacterium sp.]|uniref:hypothetical protein n=1 Tax=Mycobacterium sp. TaxID=1785 RepID=UPI002B740631|nr:hypothetical protein [Mycobacterium sp.]HTY32867.1 hypothetical protein [Mycobacterium sp.]